MYAVIDVTQIPVVKTRTEGELLLKGLRHYNTDAKWLLVVGITEAPMDELEKLYALAAMLLSASGVNPLAVGITQAKPDGTEEVTSAVAVMDAARQWLDQVQH